MIIVWLLSQIVIQIVIKASQSVEICELRGKNPGRGGGKHEAIHHITMGACTLSGAAGGSRVVLVAFVATQILPHEAELRRRLMQMGVKADVCDDIVQDAYCRLLRLDRIDHILDARSYLFRSARNIVLEQMRKSRIVSITTVQNLDDLAVADMSPSPEAVASSRAELTRVLRLIADLPRRCRSVFELRKIHGLSQAETARRLHISENVVEKETARGLTLILQTLTEGSTATPSSTQTPSVGVRHVAD